MVKGISLLLATTISDFPFTERPFQSSVSGLSVDLSVDDADDPHVSVKYSCNFEGPSELMSLLGLFCAFFDVHGLIGQHLP